MPLVSGAAFSLCLRVRSAYVSAPQGSPLSNIPFRRTVCLARRKSSAETEPSSFVTHAGANGACRASRPEFCARGRISARKPDFAPDRVLTLLCPRMCRKTLKKHYLSPFFALSFAMRPWANGACAVFWPDFGAKGGFSRRPRTYLALPKKRAKKRVFRVFFRAVFSSCRGRRCRRAAGDYFCPLAISGPRENAKYHGTTTKNGVQTA